MDRIIVWYLRMSVIYFAAGAALGFIMVVFPDKTGYFVSSHAHLNLLGFMSMMIYGVGYHILPRFSGKHIYSPRLMTIQFWLANTGLSGMAAGWPLHTSGDVSYLLISSSFLSLVSIVLFAFNILMTIKPVE